MLENPRFLVPFLLSLGASLTVGGQEERKEELAPGPRAEWPQSSPTSPFINAADYGLQLAAPAKMATEVFHENPDCTEALQAACDAGAGGVVYIPAGRYRVTRPIVIQTGTTVRGAGYCATMILTEQPIPAILHLRGVGGPMTIIRDLWTAGPVGGNWQATGIWVQGCNGVTIRDCWVSALGTGIRVDGISDTWLRNIVFELNQHGIVVECGELGWASGNLRMFDCYGYQNYQTGITLTNCRGVQMQSCSAVGSGHAILAKNCAQVTITGAQVNWDASPWRKFGIRLEDCDHITLGNSVVEGMVEYGIAAVGCKHLTLSGNVVRHTTAGPGLIVQDCELATVSSNNVSESAKDGVVVSGCRYLALMGNVVETYGQDPKSDTPAAGIRVDDQCRECEFVANLVKPVEDGGPPKVMPGQVAE
ncbi:MAG: right-handed parallel beta-helix repeat-containing protein [Planctomycetota bacterium]